MKHIIVSVCVLIVGAFIFFSGILPATFYSVLPTYINDPDDLWEETPFNPSIVNSTHLDTTEVDNRSTFQSTSLNGLGIESDTQILFGDTHVHTTNSSDAFKFSLPLMHGSQGAFPPSYACDYARFASQLDFYFITDHAEAYTPERWKDAIESVRQCNEVAFSHGYQDTYAFMGYEWTQVGVEAEGHYGHHNVLFKGLSSTELPSRPIAAQRDVRTAGTMVLRNDKGKFGKIIELLDPPHKEYYQAFNALVDDMADTENCEKGIPSNELPSDCYEEAATPKELYKKLAQWNIDSIVIPHGSSWGWYTPPGSSWESHMDKDSINNTQTPLIEIFSGHGNSERYGPYHARIANADGSFSCPEPTERYLPSCHQAGAIIKNRCLSEGTDQDTCEARAVTARHNYANVTSKSGFLTVPGNLNTQEWLDSGQARDLFLPAFNYRPYKSAQYGLALRNFEDKSNPIGYEWGFVGSTDTHTARAGHGYKQVGRLYGTEANGARTQVWNDLLLKDLGEQTSESRTLEKIDTSKLGLRLNEVERSGSFFYLGGLAAVHATERSRDAIWNALKNKQTYATSGHRLLLWFTGSQQNKSKKDSGHDSIKVSMGDKITTHNSPEFNVIAVGSPKQKDGCPDYIKQAFTEAKLEKMALGECYYPSQTRHNIERLEIIRIRPQSYKDEPVAQLIEDPWKQHQCPKNATKCEFTFTDESFSAEKRDALYYVRAIEEPTAIINGNTSRNKYDASGKLISVDICSGDYSTPASDECYGKQGHQAVSSPIYVYYK